MTEWEKIAEGQYVKCIDNLNFQIINIVPDKGLVEVRFHSLCLNEYSIDQITAIITERGYTFTDSAFMDNNNRPVPEAHVNQIIAEFISEEQTLGVVSASFHSVEEAENYIEETYIKRKNLH
jgi:hypothetical protein